MGMTDPAGGRCVGDEEVPGLFAGSMVEHEARLAHAPDIGFSVGLSQALRTRHVPPRKGRQASQRGIGPARRDLAACELLEEDVA